MMESDEEVWTSVIVLSDANDGRVDDVMASDGVAQSPDPEEAAAVSIVSCAVCQDAIDFSATVDKPLAVSMLCGHLYHEECLTSWIQNGNETCPTCRTICQRRLIQRVFPDCRQVAQSPSSRADRRRHAAEMSIVLGRLRDELERRESMSSARLNMIDAMNARFTDIERGMHVAYRDMSDLSERLETRLGRFKVAFEHVRDERNYYRRELATMRRQQALAVAINKSNIEENRMSSLRRRYEESASATAHRHRRRAQPFLHSHYPPSHRSAMANARPPTAQSQVTDEPGEIRRRVDHSPALVIDDAFPTMRSFGAAEARLCLDAERRRHRHRWPSSHNHARSWEDDAAQ